MLGRHRHLAANRDLSPNEKRALLAKLLRRRRVSPKRFIRSPITSRESGSEPVRPETSIYNVSFAGRIRSDLDVPALRRAFQALVDRHPSLRTTIAVHAGKPVQQIHEHHLVHFELTDTPAWRDDALQTRLVEETQRPSILNEGGHASEPVFSIAAGTHLCWSFIISWSISGLLR